MSVDLCLLLDLGGLRRKSSIYDSIERILREITRFSNKYNGAGCDYVQIEFQHDVLTHFRRHDHTVLVNLLNYRWVTPICGVLTRYLRLYFTRCIAVAAPQETTESNQAKRAFRTIYNCTYPLCRL